MRNEYKTTLVDLGMQFKHGDKDAFTRIFEMHHGLILNYIYRISGDRDLAEEVVQDVFMKLWNHRNGFDPSKPIKPYLLTSARNAFIDKKRRQAVRKSSDIEIHKEAIENKKANDTNLKELENVLEKALSNLNPGEKEVFILSRMEEMKYHEIATALGISIKTVEARMKRALEYLRNNLRPFLE